MRREEFFDNVTTYDDLCCLANDLEYFDLIEDIYDDDSFSSLISDRIYDMSSDPWEEVRDFLVRLPSYYEYYLDCGWDEYMGLSDGDGTFEEKQRNLFEFMCDNGLFDEDEEEDEEDESCDEEEKEQVEVISDEERVFFESVNETTEEEIFGLFTDCSKYYSTI